MTEPMRIMQVSTSDRGGGAERVAMALHAAYLRRGVDSWVAAGRKATDDPRVVEIPNRAEASAWTRALRRGADALTQRQEKMRGLWRAARVVEAAAAPGAWLRHRMGIDDHAFPGTRRLLNLTGDGVNPDIIHAHNLHGDYFDLRLLPWLSAHVPVAVTLHDAWMLSGHCAHSLDCERWKSGCGSCPYLNLEPAAARDATALNWQRKASIYQRSRLHIITPSQWLMNKVRRSMLAPAVVGASVIPNGVDLNVFHPSSKAAARRELGIPQDTSVVLFVAGNVTRSPWKDYATLSAATSLARARLSGRKLRLIALGDAGPAVSDEHVWFAGRQSDPRIVARFFHAADVYAHAARADTFPTVILEAMACGTPVVATAVGGIPEQVDDGRTGFLTPMGDAPAMADRIIRMVEDADLNRRMSRQAAAVARERFDLERQVDVHMDYFARLTGRSMIVETQRRAA